MSAGALEMLRLEELSVLRKGDAPLIERLSLSVSEGEILAVVGASGIGKSSLLNVVAGFVPQVGHRLKSPWHWFDDEDELQYRGSVLISGGPIDGLPPEHRRAIGMVMQGGIVYEHLSVLQNITFPLRAAGMRDGQQLRAAAIRLLSEVELFDGVNGGELEQKLNAKAGKLSGGQRQRIALARALAKAPTVFLLDEAFANLDPVLRTELFNRFARLVVGQPRCAMVVTHDLSDLEKAQRVLLLGLTEAGPGYCKYQRDASGSFALEEDSGGETDYWRTWNDRICAAFAH